jgi:hypothetical protein
MPGACQSYTRRMSADGSGGAGGMQFDKVDLAAPSEARACRICKRPITDEYFEIARAVICRSCATALSGSKEGRGDFGRAMLFGVGAALLGTVVWFAITKAIHSWWGFMAIGVGLLVGKAVKRGGRGLGGGRYQALAMVLTYLSITGAYVPLIVQGIADAAGETGSLPTPFPVWSVLELALRAPFMGGASNIMGIIIIGIGLYEAWKINRRVPLSGPYRFGPAAPPLIATPGAPPGAKP